MPPARPRSILLLDELPVTAVGKIYKPKLRDMAIAEKVRIEARDVCGDVSVSVDVRLDERKRTLVDVRVDDASAERLATLAAALKPLPQTYLVRSGAEAVSPGD